MKYLIITMLVLLVSCSSQKGTPNISKHEVIEHLENNQVSELYAFSPDINAPFLKTIAVLIEEESYLLDFNTMKEKESFIKDVFKKFPKAKMVSDEPKYLEKLKNEKS